MLLYLTLAVCAGLAGLLVYRYDLYDREPIPLLLATVAAGAAAMEGAGLLEDRLIALGGPFPEATRIALVASLTEESARLLLVTAVALLARRWFNDPMDGIVYGSMAGLGMAVHESVVVLGRDVPGALLLPPPELVRLGSHLVLGGITGFAVGMIRMGIPRGGRALAACMAAAVAMHFTVDRVALDSPGNPIPPARTLLVAVVVLAGMFLYGALVSVGSEWSRKIFSPRSTRTLLRWPFTLLRRRPDGPGPGGGG